MEAGPATHPVVCLVLCSKVSDADKFPLALGLGKPGSFFLRVSEQSPGLTAVGEGGWRRQGTCTT